MFIIVNCVSLNKKFQSDLEEAVMPQTPDRSQWGDPHLSSKLPLLMDQFPQSQLPASSLDPSDLPSQTAPIFIQPFCHNTPE